MKKIEKHTTAKILLILSFIGLIYLLNLLLYLIDLI